LLWEGKTSSAELQAAAAGYVDAAKEVPDVDHALAGARDIIAERLADDATLRGRVRDITRADGVVKSRVATGKANEVSKFQDYYDFSQPLKDLPSHRILAIRRGEAEGFLVWAVDAPAERITGEMEFEFASRNRAADQMRLVVQDAYKRLISPAVEVDLRLEMKTRADEEAIAIFGKNLEQLLLAPPAGERVVIGLDPGFRTGVKVAVVSKTGAVAATDAFFLHQPERFAQLLLAYVARFNPDLISIGNGTASRETETLTRDILAERKLSKPQVVVVNESGASVYSASELARDELPDLDVSLRGAVSIARRLQDPLAELVKIDPKSIGVGQYQHDVSQPRLKALFGAGLLVHRLGDYQRADALAQERLVLARRLEDGEAVATSMIALGLAAQGLGDDEGAAAAYTEAAELARAGGYTWFLGIATSNLGDLLRDQGDYVQARARLEEALEIFRQLGDERFVTVSLANLGFLAAREGRNDEAEALLREGLVYAEARVDTELAIWCLTELSALTLSKGDAKRAARLTGAMEALREETGHAPTPDLQRLSEQTRSALVSELGEEQVAAALAVGREMAFEQAMAYALQT